VVELDLGHVAGTTRVRRGMDLNINRLKEYLSKVIGE
jgi:hypothetical protein